MRLGLAAFAGLVASLGLAPFGLWPLALLGFACVFTLSQTAQTRREAGLLSWAAGSGYFLLALVWIVEPFFVEPWRHGWMAPFALLFMSGGLALFWAAAGAVSFRLGALGWIAAHGLAELARAYVLTGFPWALVGYLFAESATAIYASLLGPHGLTLITLSIAAALATLANRHWKQAALPLLAALGLLAYAPFFSQNSPLPTNAPIIRLVQPNAAQHEKWDPELIPMFFERQLEFTNAPSENDKAPALIVWPETAIPWTLDRAEGALEMISQAAGDTPVVLGLQRFEGVRLFNSLLLLDGKGAQAALYDKYHLVPFGEYMPLGNALTRFGINGLAARNGNGYSAGTGPKLININGLGNALPLICYEAVFPQDVAAAPERPALLLQVTNDAWFGNFSGPHQHLSQARMRAIEQGLPMIRAANTGVSAIIGPKGEIIAALGLGQSGFLDAPLPEALPPTLYARTGDWLILIAMVLLLCTGYGLAHRAPRAPLNKH